MSVPTSNMINIHAELQTAQKGMRNQSTVNSNLPTFAHHLKQENQNNYQNKPQTEQYVNKGSIFGKDNIVFDQSLFEKANALLSKGEALKNSIVQQINSPSTSNSKLGMALELKRNAFDNLQEKRFNVSKAIFGTENRDISKVQNLDGESILKQGTVGSGLEKRFNISNVIVGAERAESVRNKNYDKVKVDYQRTNAIDMLAQGMKGGSSLLDMARNSVSLRNLQAMVGGFSLSSPDYFNNMDVKNRNVVNNSLSGAQGRNRSDNSDSLGSLSAKFESGSEGISSIGYDRNGGTSYGKYQIASRVGSMDKFLSDIDASAPDIAERLRKAGPANTGGRGGGMPSEWKKIAAEQPERFEKLQEQFIYDNYYKPALNSITEKTSLQEKNISPAMEEVIWSTAIQHGPGAAARIFAKAENRVGDMAQGKEYHSEMISAVYDIRTGQFGSSTEQVRRSVHNRLEQEKLLALNMLEGNKIQLA